MSSRRRRVIFLLVAACASPIVGYAKQASICPQLRDTRVHQIDIFDGAPEELAYLAPDDPDTAPNTYTIGHIYSNGRFVSVRCHYDNGEVRDVKIEKRVRVCRYSEAGKTRSPSLVCR